MTGYVGRPDIEVLAVAIVTGQPSFFKADSAMGLINALGNLGGFVGPSRGGFLQDVSGGSFLSTAVVLAVALVLGGLVMLTLRRQADKPVLVAQPEAAAASPGRGLPLHSGPELPAAGSGVVESGAGVVASGAGVVESKAQAASSAGTQVPRVPGERSHAGCAPVLPASPLVWLLLDTKTEVDVLGCPPL